MSLHSLDPASSSTPLVSVAMTVFNGEAWLAKAIESVLSQQTAFPVEIIIGDDCSTDSTIAVAHRYQQKYPQIIRVLDRPENIGTQRNYYETFEHCRGKFIAWLDADDYWTHPGKLTAQVEALENDPTIMICGHYVRWVTRGGEVTRDRYPILPPGRHGMADILRRNFLPSPSVVFRNGLHHNLPQWYFDVSPLTDWPLYVVAAKSGDILMLDHIMADYTLSPKSAFWAKGDLFWHKMDADFYERVESIAEPEFHRIIREEKGRRYEAIAYLLRKQGDFTGSRQAALKAFNSPAALDNLESKTKALLASIAREAQWRLRGPLNNSEE
jgi:glycosyltransferase involved in cell wall biosynthesis